MPDSQLVLSQSDAIDETSPLLYNGQAALGSETSSLLDSSDSSDDGSLPVSYGIYSPTGDDLEAERCLGGSLAGPSIATTRSLPAPVASVTITKVVSVLLIGVFTSNVDIFLVMATHPVIASEFNVLGDSSWLFIGFSLAGAATQTLYAKLSDIYGRKMLLLWSYALFAIGCAMVGLGQSYWQVILGRVISGSGGSGMTTLVALFITVPLREVASWQSYLNVFATLGRGVGGPLGGWLADTIGWHWSFLGQAPLFLIALALCWVTLPDPPPATAGCIDESGESEAKSRFSRIDFLGATLLGLAILALMFPLEIGGDKIPWTHPLIFTLFSSGVLLALLFLATEARWAKEPIFPLVLLRTRDVTISYMIMACQVAAQTGMMFSVPLYFQVTARASNSLAGAHLFPAVAGNAAGGILSGWLIRRTGRYKILIIFGTVSSSISYIALILRWQGHTNWLESLEIIPGGFGTGIAQSAVFISLQAAIDPEHKAAAASGLFLSFPIGITVGLAVVSAVMLGTMRKTLDQRLIRLGLEPAQRTKVIEKATSSVDYLDQIRGDVYQAVVAGYVDGLRWSHGVSLALALCGFGWALLLRRHTL